MKYELSEERRLALLAALRNEGAWGALVHFLDTIDSLEELEAISPLFRQHAEVDSLWLLDFYQKNLVEWPQPRLDEAFLSEFPLVSKRLDTTWKVRIFLRAAQSRRLHRDTLAKMFEEVLHRHEAGGEDLLHYPHHRGDDFGTALRILYHTELVYWTVKDLVLGEAGSWSCMVSEGFGLWVYWGEEAKKMAEEQLHKMWDTTAA